MSITIETSANKEALVLELYKKLLQSWNNHNGNDFANLFTEDGNTIGFDGSQINGRKEIRAQLEQIFANHKVASYIGIVREIRALSATVFLLSAVAGMIPPSTSIINPSVNVIHTLIAQKHKKEFLIAIFQNTPAAFHGRPELSRELTDELQTAYNNHKK